jgi:zinc transport system ATP-binding protein
MIELRNLTKYFGEKLLIDNVSFTIQKGDLTTLVGPNGAGKTTIAKLILGLEKPFSGEILIEPGIKVDYVPQKLNLSHHLPLTSEKFLELLAPLRKIDDDFGILEFMDFDKIKKQNIAKLSEGQFQKLLIGSTLLNKPDFIILDEPTQSLDINSQQEFYKLLEQLKKIWSLTVFIISHDLFTVMKNSDQVICINGHVCCSGKPEDFSENKEFIDGLSSIGFYAHHHDHKH